VFDTVGIMFEAKGEKALMDVFAELAKSSDKALGASLRTNLADAELATKAWREDLHGALDELKNAGTAGEKLSALKKVRAVGAEKPQEQGFASKAAGAAVGGTQAAVSAATGTLGGIAKAASGPVEMLADMIGKFVGAINPAAIEVFSQAIGDMMATIGEQLQPVFEVLITHMQKLGDFIANIDLGPIVESATELLTSLSSAMFEVLEACKPLVDMLIQGFADALKALMPMVEPLTSVVMSIVDALQPLVALLIGGLKMSLELLVPVVKAVAWAIDKLVDGLYIMVNYIADIVQKISAGAIDMHMTRSSKRSEEEKAAARGDRSRATMSGGISISNIDAISHRALQAAGKAGQGSRKPEEITADNTTKANALLSEILHKPTESTREQAKSAMDFARDSIRMANEAEAQMKVMDRR
jgi:hypothetical protein